MSRLEELLKLVKKNDSAMLRFAIGHEYLKRGRTQEATHAFARCVELDPRYTAGWKLYAHALREHGDPDGAADAYEKGIAVAEARGDRQAAKEMQVFLKRLQKANEP